MEPTPVPIAAPVLRVSALSAATLVRLQAASGLVFVVFAGLHLLNTALGAFGADAYNGFQRALRPLYQHPLVELASILVPLAVHAATSVLRMRARRGQAGRATMRTRAHRYAGWFLLAVMGGHIAATRGPALLKGAVPEFEGVAFTFQFLPTIFYPYYTLLALTGLVHQYIGVPTALRRLGVRVPAVWTSGLGARVSLAFAALALLFGLAGLGGLLFPLEERGAGVAGRLRSFGARNGRGARAE
jgi:succinate dehydrogenase/fumarate reductase cytochrome b subunit